MQQASSPLLAAGLAASDSPLRVGHCWLALVGWSLASPCGLLAGYHLLRARHGQPPFASYCPATLAAASRPCRGAGHGWPPLQGVWL
ncbi:hypothetical protein BHM03_00054055 [Ensete ventricosum]|nr:hypothetical protein BHM03_00054055 [Ensete ventricosum]